MLLDLERGEMQFLDRRSDGWGQIYSAWRR